MNDIISPKYQMKLVREVCDTIWQEFSSYKEVKLYIEKWQFTEPIQNHSWEKFKLATKDTGDIDLLATLHNIDGETLLKIAIDLGIDTPDFIPCIPTFRNELKTSYEAAFSTFERAFKQIEEHPDLAIGLANSALESIIKEILKDDRINSKIKATETLYGLTTEILKIFQLYPTSEMPVEIKTIGSAFLSINQSVEKLRSEKTTVHGKTTGDYIINSPIYAYFVVNSISTVGLFINSFYKTKFPTEEIKTIETDVDDLPF